MNQSSSSVITTPKFRKELKTLRHNEYKCSGADLSKALGKKPSYISHIETGQIKKIKPSSLNVIADYISKHAIKTNKAQDYNTLKHKIYTRLSYTLSRNAAKELDYIAFLREYNINFNDTDFKKIIKQLLEEKSLSFPSLVANIVNKEPIEILYDMHDETKSHSCNSEIFMHDNPFTENCEINVTYNDLFAIFFCLYNMDMNESEAQQKAKEQLLSYNAFPSFDEYMDMLKEREPELYDLLIQQDKFADTLGLEENKVLSQAQEFGGKIAVALKENPEILEILCTSVQKLDTKYIMEIYGKNYARIMYLSRIERENFIKELNGLVTRYHLN